MLATIWESCYKRFFHDQNNLYHIRNWVFYINLNNIYDSKADPNCLFLKRHKYLFSTILRRTSPSSKIDLEFPQQLPTTRLDIIPKASNGRDSRAASQTQVATSRLEHVAVHLERLPPYVLPKINHLLTSHSVEGFGGIFVYKNLLCFVTLLRYRVVRGEGKAVKILHASKFCVEKSGFFDFTNHMSCVSAW